MLKLFQKIFKTPSLIAPVKIVAAPAEISSIGKAVAAKVKKLFRGSLAIRVVTAGGTNACEQELVALGNSYYDIDRFGVHFVASPRHADMLIVTGPVSRNMRESLKRTYEAMPEPRIVVALGDDAIDGGIFKGSYAVLDGAKAVIPVDYEIAGDPPSPEIIIKSLLSVLNDREIRQKTNK
ncbi:MAG: NADH-quinone oxidoreductase subunit NuoB [Candidatus Vogelbacteria bacterium]|nr:NADH-quinone oxidoreductase subunit NuoB [Candidatus Vogelbacteria bacterium]